MFKFISIEIIVHLVIHCFCLRGFTCRFKAVQLRSGMWSFGKWDCSFIYSLIYFSVCLLGTWKPRWVNSWMVLFPERVSLSLVWCRKFRVSNKASGDGVLLVASPHFKSCCTTLSYWTGIYNSPDALSRNDLSQLLGRLPRDRQLAPSGIVLVVESCLVQGHTWSQNGPHTMTACNRSI